MIKTSKYTPRRAKEIKPALTNVSFAKKYLNEDLCSTEPGEINEPLIGDLSKWTRKYAFQNPLSMAKGEKSKRHQKSVSSLLESARFNYKAKQTRSLSKEHLSSNSPSMSSVSTPKIEVTNFED